MRALPRKVDHLVIGAGYSGLNAVAGFKWARPSSQTLCIDRRGEPGGSWADYYDYVHLHTPAQLFGVSGHPWAHQDPDRLVSRNEVMAHCASFVKQSMPPSFSFQGQMELRSVRPTGTHGSPVVATVRDLATGTDNEVEASTVINATGFRYEGHMPAVSDVIGDGSLAAAEIPASALTAALASRGAAPRTYVVVGGGKTGMDTVLHLRDHMAADDEVVLIQGRGRYFINLHRFLPPKASASLRTETFPEALLRWAHLWDDDCGGDGVKAGEALLSSGEFLAVGGARPDTCMMGSLTEEEKTGVEATARFVNGEHLVGVRRAASGATRLLLRSGAELETRPETVIINCRSSISQVRRNAFTADAHVLRPDGTLDPGALLGLTGPANYLVAILSCTKPAAFEHMTLYGMRAGYVGRKMGPDWIFEGAARALANSLTVGDEVGPAALRSCTLDPLRWVPFPRQVYAIVLLAMARGDILDRAERRCRRLVPYEEEDTVHAPADFASPEAQPHAAHGHGLAAH